MTKHAPVHDFLQELQSPDRRCTRKDQIFLIAPDDVAANRVPVGLGGGAHGVQMIVTKQGMKYVFALGGGLVAASSRLN